MHAYRATGVVLLSAPGLQLWGPFRQKYGVGALTLTFFLFHYSLISDVRMAIDDDARKFREEPKN